MKYDVAQAAQLVDAFLHQFDDGCAHPESHAVAEHWRVASHALTRHDIRQAAIAVREHVHAGQTEITQQRY